jgi:hypothetical protein
MKKLVLLGCLLLTVADCLLAPPAAAQDQLQPVYTHVEQMPDLLGGGGEAAIQEALQQGVLLPFGTPVPAANSHVVVRFVVGTVGEIGEVDIVQGLSPAVDEAVMEAARNLPRFSPGKQGRRYVRVAFMLTVQAPGATTTVQRREAITRWQRTARRQPGEADSTFVRRVLPISYSSDGHDLLAGAWRPSAFGKQLFFSRRSGDANEGGTDLFVLDPYQPDTYAVQVLAIPSQGDLTDLAAFFFADTNHDGRKELLAISSCDLRERVEVGKGEYLTGRVAHYQTLIWHYADLSHTGPPEYKEDVTSRSYLDELPTAAAVRQALARHERRRLATPIKAVGRATKAPR